MQAGLPVLARINPGNDLAALIESRNVGLVYVGEELAMFQKLAATLCGAPPSLLAMSRNARSLAKDAFAVSSAVQQISGALLPS
jgi:hypothetical protein